MHLKKILACGAKKRRFSVFFGGVFVRISARYVDFHGFFRRNGQFLTFFGPCPSPQKEFDEVIYVSQLSGGCQLQKRK